MAELLRDDVKPHPAREGHLRVGMATRVQATVGHSGLSLEDAEPRAQRVWLDGGAVSLGADPALVGVRRTEGEPFLGTLRLPAAE
jgi:hypothetical protein